MAINIKKTVVDYKIYFLVALIYLLLAFVRFDKIAANITTTVPGATGDTFQNLWGLWWVGYALFHLHQGIYFTRLVFWPLGANLVYQTMSPIGSLFVYPLEIVSIPFAYNSLFFIGFVVAGLTTFILTDYLVKNKYAAFMAGVFFSFSAFHIAEAYSHLDWINIGWVPLALYFFLKIMNGEHKNKNYLGLGASFVLTVFMGDIEQGIFVILFFFFIILLYLIKKRSLINLKLFKALAISALIAFILGSWGFIPILLTVAKSSGVSIANEFNTVSQNVLQSDDILSFFLPSFYGGPLPTSIFLKYYARVFTPASSSPVERTGYITYTVLALAVLALYKNFKTVKLWAAIALIFAILALGPAIHIASFAFFVGPFFLLHYIPLLNIIEEPARMGLVLFLALAIMGAYGFAELLKILAKKTNYKYATYAVVILLTVAFLFETSGTPITNSITNTTTNATIPNFYYSLRNMTNNVSMLWLPALPNPTGIINFYTGKATYYTSATHIPILSGYITRANHTEVDYLYNIPLVVETSDLQAHGNASYGSPVQENYTDQTLLILYTYKTATIIFDKGAFNNTDGSYVYGQLSSTFGNPFYQDNSIATFNTINAIKAAAYKTFVEYPAASEWNPVLVPYEGRNITMWFPVGGGVIAIYPPYPNNTNVSYDVNTNQVYKVNATMNFYAIALDSVRELKIYERVGNGNPIETYQLNITTTLSKYTVKLPGLLDGKFGNTVFFITSQNSEYAQQHNDSDVIITNITVSR